MKKNLLRIISGTIITLTLLFLAAVGISFFVLKSYLPSYSKELRVKGLRSEVEIFTDSLGVPYIVANNEEDVAFSLGFVHARERMFQMDLYRRAALGKLSEVVGNKAVKVDKMFRSLGINRAVEKIYNNLDEKTRKILLAYSDGVNAYLSSKKWHSVEFDLLGYEPEKWKPEHSIAVSKLLAWELNMGWWTRIVEAQLFSKFPKQAVREIFPNGNPNALTSSNDIKENFVNPRSFAEANLIAKKILRLAGSHIGSNNWAVSPRLSESGKPIIANDTHLAFSLPDQWFVAVIRENKLTVGGFTLPGVPGVLIGENGAIAWTETNLMDDEAIFFLEKTDVKRKLYFNEGKWRKLKVIEDTLKVKDSSDVVFKIYSTSNGVIISDVHPYTFLFPDSSQKKIVLSMKWPALNSTGEFMAIGELNRARNFTEFKNALEQYSYPGQNFVYADSSGNIGYVCAAKLLKIKKGEWKDLYDGTKSKVPNEFVPYKTMPKIFNPPSGFIATANNRVGVNFKYHISDLWEPPARFNRISSLLKSGEKFSVKDFQKMQSDELSYYPKEIVKELLRAFRNAKIEDENLNLALKLLRNWDFKFTVSSQPATVYSVFFVKLLGNIFKDEMSENLFKEFVFVANVPLKAINNLLRDKYSYWWDDKTTTVREDRDEILRKSLVDALVFLEKRFGKNIALWQWGRLHKLTLKHPFHGRKRFVDRLFDVGPFEVGGCGTTLFNTEFSFYNPYGVTLGQAMRFIYDFSTPQFFYFTLPSGQSGHVLSPHYGETTRNWLSGKYYKLNTKLRNAKNIEKTMLLPE